MNYLKARLLRELARHFGQDDRRIDHALAVLSHAEALLAESPGADAEVVISAAVTHDFGIVEAERLHGTNTGPMQEQYGPPVVREALTRIGLAPEKNEAVCAIVARHHSPPSSPSLDFLILYESDWLVNIDDFPEIKSDPARLQGFVDRNFHSPAGLRRARQILLGDGPSSKAAQEENPLFKRMGAFYKLLVDEEKRRAKEAPYLLELAQRAIPDDLRPQSPVLDLACGTGFHSRILASGGFRVLAIDSSPAVLAEAAELTAQSPPANMIDYRVADLFDPLPADRPIRLALLLGNTLSLFPPANASRLIAHIAEAIAPGGIFLLQVLNFQRLRRAGGSTVTRHGTVNGREALFTKALAPTDDGNFLLTMTASQPASDKPEGEWESFCQSTRMTALQPAQIRDWAAAANLQLVAEYGSFSREAFSPIESHDWIAEFQKKR